MDADGVRHVSYVAEDDPGRASVPGGVLSPEVPVLNSKPVLPTELRRASARRASLNPLHGVQGELHTPGSDNIPSLPLSEKRNVCATTLDLDSAAERFPEELPVQSASSTPRSSPRSACSDQDRAYRLALQQNLHRQELWRATRGRSVHDVTDKEGSEVVVADKSPADKKPKQHPTTFPMTLIFVLATVMSIAANVAGGLFMYYRAVESLEQSVEETSAGDLDLIAVKINSIAKLPLRVGERLINGLYHDDGIVLGTESDYATWAQNVQGHAFASLTAFEEAYCSGVVLLPQDGREDEAAYFVSWVDPLRNGSRILSAGMRYKGAPYSTPLTYNNVTDVYEMPIPSYAVEQPSGKVMDYLYSWNAGYYLKLLRGFDPAVDLSMTTKGWSPVAEQGLHRTYGIRYRGNEAWRAPDKHPYAYSGWDVVYAPPPPPHPWSKYKGVASIHFFLYQTWQEPINTYAEQHPGTTIVLLDAVTRDIYTSTSGELMLISDCFAKEWDGSVGHAPKYCSTNLQNMSVVVQEAWEVLADTDNAFCVADLHRGGAYFLRKQHLFADVWMLWMRPVSSVEDKINGALAVLAVFAVVILLVDTAIAVAEVVFVVLPIKRLSLAITSLGNMMTEEASRILAAEMKKPVMVTEMHTLVAGAQLSVANLNEYRAYLPDASLQVAADTPKQRAAPTGFIAIAFSDIVGSTALWEAFPDDCGHAIDLHFSALRVALRRHKGYEVKTIGDGMMSTFDRAQDAYEFGLDAHVELVRQPWPEILSMYPSSETETDRNGDVIFTGLRIRMGIHCGEVDVDINPLTGRVDYRARSVNKAARIEAQALPGMTAFSEDILKNISATQPVHELGTRDLKGIGPVPLYYSIHRAIGARERKFKLQIAALESDSRTSTPRGRRRSSPHVFIVSDRYQDVGGEAKSDTEAPHPNLLLWGAAAPAMVPIPAPTAAPLQRSIKRKVGAVTVMHLSRVQDELSRGSGCDVLLNVINNSLQMALDVGNKTGGKVEAVFDSIVVMSWGLSSSVSEPDRNCLQFLGSLHARAGTDITTGAVVGPFLHGNVGTRQRRYHTILGRGYQYAHRLPHLTVRYGIPSLVVVAQGISVRLSKCCAPVDIVRSCDEYGPFVVLERPIFERCVKLELTWESTFAPDCGQAALLDDPVVLFRGALVEAAARKEALAPQLRIPGLPRDIAALHELVAARGRDVIAEGDLSCDALRGVRVFRNLSKSGEHEPKPTLSPATAHITLTPAASELRVQEIPSLDAAP